MVGDARDRHRDMSARRTAAADGGSCHRDARVGTLRPGDKTPRGRRALIVSNRLSSPPLAILAARPVKGGPARPRECRFPRSLGAAQGLHREVGVRDARSILYFSPARSSSVRGEINPFLLEVPRAAPRVIKSSRGSSPAGQKGLERASLILREAGSWLEKRLYLYLYLSREIKKSIPSAVCNIRFEFYVFFFILNMNFQNVKRMSNTFLSFISTVSVFPSAVCDEALHEFLIDENAELI